MVEVLEKINHFVWGIPTLLLILGVGVYLSIKTGFFQLTDFPKAWRSFISKLKPGKDATGGVSAYQALCTALAATVGTGNIAGVAGAITVGGPGAIFWMWICAFFGMIIKCAEATLSVRYKSVKSSGEVFCGPMYMIENGLGHRYKWLGVLYAFFGVVAAFGVGNATQINAVIDSIHSTAAVWNVELSFAADIAIAVVLALLVVLMLSGGAKRIGRIAERLVPYAAVAYILLGLGVLVVRFDAIPAAFEAILKGAFAPRAVTGGIIGSLFLVCKTGAARGVFTNEAGMGTASIAHGAAQVRHPAEQGLMGIVEVFLDTIVICTITALVILCSGIDVPYGADAGAALTTQAFSEIYGGWVCVLIALCLLCFALATVLGWGFYGLRCAQYLFGENVWRLFVVMQAFTVVLGAVLQTGTVWLLAETVNGLMAIPNLIALLGLSPEFIKLIRDFKRAQPLGGTYEDFNQCQSLRTVTYAEISPAGGKGKKRRKNHLSSEYRSA